KTIHYFLFVSEYIADNNLFDLLAPFVKKKLLIVQIIRINRSIECSMNQCTAFGNITDGNISQILFQIPRSSASLQAFHSRCRGKIFSFVRHGDYRGATWLNSASSSSLVLKSVPGAFTATGVGSAFGSSTAGFVSGVAVSGFVSGTSLYSASSAFTGSVVAGCSCAFGAVPFEAAIASVSNFGPDGFDGSVVAWVSG